MNVTTFAFSNTLWIEMFRTGNRIGGDFNEKVMVTAGFPQGAIIRDVRYTDHGMNRGQIEVLVEHESFPELGAGDSMWTTHYEVVMMEVITKPEDD